MSAAAPNFSCPDSFNLPPAYPSVSLASIAPTPFIAVRAFAPTVVASFEPASTADLAPIFSAASVAALIPAVSAALGVLVPAASVVPAPAILAVTPETNSLALSMTPPISPLIAEKIPATPALLPSTLSSTPAPLDAILDKRPLMPVFAGGSGVGVFGFKCSAISALVANCPFGLCHCPFAFCVNPPGLPGVGPLGGVPLVGPGGPDIFEGKKLLTALKAAMPVRISIPYFNNVSVKFPIPSIIEPVILPAVPPYFAISPVIVLVTSVIDFANLPKISSVRIVSCIFILNCLN